MSEKPKSIAEALAEVQRKVNEERARRVAEMAQEIEDENIEEGLLGTAFQAGKSLAKNFVGGVKGVNVKGTPIPGRGAVTAKATDMERTANKAGKAVAGAADAVKTKAAGAVDAVKSNPGKTAAAAAAAGTAAGTAALKTASSSTPDAPKTSGGISPAKPNTSISPAPKADTAPKSGPANPVKKTFGQAFADARKKAGGAGGKFNYNNKEYQTNTKGEKYAAPSKLKSVGEEAEETKSKISEALINAFLVLHGQETANMFVEAKKLSDQQKKLAAVGGNPHEIDAGDFKALRAGKKLKEESRDHLGGSTVTKDKPKEDPSTPKTPYTGYKGGNKAGAVISNAKGAIGMKEEVEELDELHKKTLKSYQRKATTSLERANRKADQEEDKSMSTDGNKYPEKQKRHMDNASKHIDTANKREKGLAMVKKKLHKEEVGFSEAELAHFEAVAKKETSKKDNGLNDTVDSSDLTN